MFSPSSDFRRFRRSTRVRLKVSIKAYGIEAPVTCEGDTIVVNLHGALISTAIGLNVGMMTDIHVYLMGKRAIAKVVYVDPAQPLHCGFLAFLYPIAEADNVRERLGSVDYCP